MSLGAGRRGDKKRISLVSRPVLYAGNGLRSVPLAKTLAAIERFFLENVAEAQFEMSSRPTDGTTRAVLEYLGPRGELAGSRYTGKGADRAQTMASACMEFIERFAAGPRPEDFRLEADLSGAGSEACDPSRFCLSAGAADVRTRAIDWVWGYSLTRSRSVLVPANLVFLPYRTDVREKRIAWTDSNGLASGNCLEEAILHGILEVIERDAVMIAEYNRLPLKEVRTEGLPAEALAIRKALESKGFACSLRSVPTDLPIPVIAAFVRSRERPSCCSVAFGCHLSPALAVARALTEAVQLLPPSYNHRGWQRSGSPERYAAPAPQRISFGDLPDRSSRDLKTNIRACVAILKGVGVEVIVVDLSLPDVAFPVVRALATGLQPLLHEGDMRISPRFFDVPLKLGLRAGKRAPAKVRIWPLCGYR